MIKEKYNIKGMVCNRCIKVLRDELDIAGVVVLDVQLGHIEVEYDSAVLSSSKIRQIILDNEFEIVESKELVLVEETKRAVIRYVRECVQNMNLSEFLAETQSMSYDLISRNFSKNCGKTVERYFMQLKIEQVKEWIEVGAMNFGEMAFRLNYHNLSALSRQFKVETGMTMKEYKDRKKSDRIPWDEL